jgi:hypothetical protein
VRPCPAVQCERTVYEPADPNSIASKLYSPAGIPWGVDGGGCALTPFLNDDFTSVPGVELKLDTARRSPFVGGKPMQKVGGGRKLGIYDRPIGRSLGRYPRYANEMYDSGQSACGTKKGRLGNSKCSARG